MQYIVLYNIYIYIYIILQLNKERPTRCHLFFYFNYLMLNMFRMLVHPSSGACDLFVELFHGLYYSVRIEVFALLTYVLAPWCRVLLEQLTGLQLVKKFPRISRNPKVHYRTHKRPPPISILGQPKPVHIPTSHLLEIHPNIIHPSTPRSPQWSLSLRFPHQDPINLPLLTHTYHMPSPSHSSRFYHPHNIGCAVQIIQLLVMQSPPFPRCLVPP